MTAILPSWVPRREVSPARDLRKLKLPEALAERAEQLATTHGIRAQDAFVEFFEALLSRLNLPAFKHADIVRLLDTDEQRALASKLLKQSIPAARSFADRETLSALLFQLAELPHDDDAVSSFVQAGMQHTLERRTGTFQSRNKHFNDHDARDALLGCKRIFDAAGKRFFLDRGTLLGAVREGGFIASDYDIDVGIFADEITLDEVKGLFVGSEFELIQDFEFKVGFANHSGIHIDFFLTTRERGYYLSKGARNMHYWYFTPFELMEYPFLGESFYIPATFEKHLDENYGNWRDPAIFYDLSYDEPCVVYGNGPEPFSYLSKRLGRGLRSGSRYESTSAANGLAQKFDLDVRDRFPLGATPTVCPIEPPAWSPRPILVVGRFETYMPVHRRVLESAMSITPDVRIHVVRSPLTADVEDALTVAGAIDRVTSVEAAHVSADQAMLDLDYLIAAHPMAVVIEHSLADLLPSTHVAALLDIGCDVALFDESTVALNLVDARVIARDAVDHS